MLRNVRRIDWKYKKQLYTCFQAFTNKNKWNINAKKLLGSSKFNLLNFKF